MSIPNGYSLGTYLVLRVLGAACFAVMRYLEKRNLLIVEGVDHLIEAIETGPVMAAANHPSILETVILPNLLYRQALKDQRFFPYSLPDENLLPGAIRSALYRYGRCIKVSRSGKDGSILSAVKVLRDRDVLIVHPEGGRTVSVNRQTGLPSEYVQCEETGRKMRLPVKGVTTILKGGSAESVKLIPIWVALPKLVNSPGLVEAKQPDWFFDVLIEMFRSGNPIRISIGEAIDGRSINSPHELAKAILAT